MIDAETGQRGYLLTGEERYVEPFTEAQAALPDEIAVLRALARDANSRANVEVLDKLTRQKIDELGQTIALRRSGDAAGALEVVRTDRGKAVMDRIRSMVDETKASERTALDGQQAEFQRAVTLSTWATWGGAATLAVLLSLAAIVMSRDFRARETQVWIRTGQMASPRLCRASSGSRRSATTHCVSCEVSGRAGRARFRADPDGSFRRVAGYAMPPVDEADRFRPGDGLVGQAAKDNRASTSPTFRRLPAGRLEPRARQAARAAHRAGQRRRHGPCGRRARFLHRVLPRRAGVARSRVRIARRRRSRVEGPDAARRAARGDPAPGRGAADAAGRAARQQRGARGAEPGAARNRRRAWKRSRRSSSRSTRSSKSRRRSSRRRRTTCPTRRSTSPSKAAELERANQYKSEFLANMSHELRTPLNSSLILAKLLADNKDGNLTDEQVKFAQTICSAGNDLLALINDILDLSKIEAGKVELTTEAGPRAPIRRRRSIKTLRSRWPSRRAWRFNTVIEPGTPERIETDAPARSGRS